MSILYRRFVLVAAFIAAMGAITANIIQDTRTARNAPLNGIQGISPLSAPCVDMRLCKIAPRVFASTRLMRG